MAHKALILLLGRQFFSPRGRSIWVPEQGEQHIRVLTAARQPWWRVWDLTSEVESWITVEGRQLQARRLGADEWAVQPLSEHQADLIKLLDAPVLTPS